MTVSEETQSALEMRVAVQAELLVRVETALQKAEGTITRMDSVLDALTGGSDLAVVRARVIAIDLLIKREEAKRKFWAAIGVTVVGSVVMGAIGFLGLATWNQVRWNIAAHPTVQAQPPSTSNTRRENPPPSTEEPK